MKKKIAVMFLLLFALAFAFGALVSTSSAANMCQEPGAPCWAECDLEVRRCMECCPSPTGPRCNYSLQECAY